MPENCSASATSLASPVKKRHLSPSTTSCEIHLIANPWLGCVVMGHCTPAMGMCWDDTGLMGKPGKSWPFPPASHPEPQTVQCWSTNTDRSVSLPSNVMCQGYGEKIPQPTPMSTPAALGWGEGDPKNMHALKTEVSYPEGSVLAAQTCRAGKAQMFYFSSRLPHRGRCSKPHYQQ